MKSSILLSQLFSQTPFSLLKVRINTHRQKKKRISESKKKKEGKNKTKNSSLMHPTCCPEPFPFACAQREPFLSGQRTPFTRPLVKQGQMHPSKFPPVMQSERRGKSKTPLDSSGQAKVWPWGGGRAASEGRGVRPVIGAPSRAKNSPSRLMAFSCCYLKNGNGWHPRSCRCNYSHQDPSVNIIWPISIIWTVRHDGLGNWFCTDLTKRGKVHSK